MPPTLTDAEAAALPALIESLTQRGTGRVPIVEQLGRIAMHTWQPGRPPGHQEALIADYVETLCRYPRYALAEAFVWARENCKWFPKLAELKERVEAIDAPRVVALKRVEYLQQLEARRAPRKPQKQASPAEIEEINRALAEMGCAVRVGVEPSERRRGEAA